MLRSSWILAAGAWSAPEPRQSCPGGYVEPDSSGRGSRVRFAPATWPSWPSASVAWVPQTFPRSAGTCDDRPSS
eukprot:Skav225948  [mRNA]  locus=scaffold1500:592919:596932:- [translate_table: standard]